MGIGKIAVLGGGPGSQSTAADLALRRFEVHFWGRNRWKLASILMHKQVRMVGAINGTAQLAGASDDLGRTIKDAQLIIVALPGYAHRSIAEQCAPFVEDGQVILICGNSGMGSVEFARTFRNKGVAKDVIFAEWNGIPAGGRLLEPGVINTALGAPHFSRYVGVFPAKRTQEAMSVISQAYPAVPACENSLAATLRIRAINHQPVVMLMSTTAIEHLVYWDITAEGHTPSVVRVIKAVDDERKAIERGWGFGPTELFMPGHLSGEKRDWESVRALREKGAWKDRLDMKHRFVTEAIPYGFVLWSSAARKAAVATPVMDAVIRIFSTINNEDYFSIGRNLENLGLSCMKMEEIRRFLYEGGAFGKN